MSSHSSWNDRAAALLHAAAEAAARAHRGALAQDLARLHALFTSERRQREPGYLREPGLRRAYLGYFAPLNAVKIARLLAALAAEGRVALPAAPRVLDLGAGPLSGISGAWIARGALGPSVAVDLATRALEEGRGLLEAAGGSGDVPSLSLRTASVTSSWRRPGDEADLIILANVLNEVGDPRRDLSRRRKVLEAALACLAPGGRLLVVEPGTRVHGRALMRLRDAILDTGAASVLAPCFGARRCPLLSREADWCHHELPWEPPAATRALERAAGIEKSTLKLSYLLLGSRGTEAPTGMRLVGGVMRGSDAERRYACSGEGLVVLRGVRAALPAPLAAAPRGAALPPSPNGTRVLRDDRRPQRPAPVTSRSKPSKSSRRGRGAGAR